MKTEQQLRFEAANDVAFPTGRFCYVLNGVGDYAVPYIEDRYIGFQLGEASGLALAAAECEKKANKHAIRYEKYGAGTDTLASDTCGECAEAIRALMTEG
jgi:hypothetical protein